MLINQKQRDELELAFSCCTDHEYRLPVKHKHLKTDYTTSGFSREEAKEILIEFYRDNGYTDVHNFFKKHRTSHTEFRRVRDWFDFDIKRFYRIDDGPVYRLQWKPIREVLKQKRLNHAVTRYRNEAFKKGYGDTRDLVMVNSFMLHPLYKSRSSRFKIVKCDNHKKVRKFCQHPLTRRQRVDLTYSISKPSS